MQDTSFDIAENTRKRLLEQVRETTTSPGVYLMKDLEGVVLYVGKAKSLRSRISSYFQKAPHPSIRTTMLVSRIEKFDIILTETEAEALILECTLIKKYKPRFNVMLKDDKAYPYIRIQIEEPFPRLEWTRRVKRDGSRYFGPFPSAWEAKQVLQLLNETFKLRDCSDNTFRHRSRPCILYQMERCSGSCVQKVSAEDYRETIREVVSILEGKGVSLIQRLEGEMAKASEQHEYELAAQYRDQIKNLQVVTETQGVLLAGSTHNRDVMGLARKDTLAHGTILQVRGGTLVSVKHFRLENVDENVTDQEVLFDFLAQHYLRKTEEGTGVAHPQEVLLPVSVEDSDLLEKVLELTLRVPETPEEQQLVRVAQTNAQHAMESGVKKGHGMDVLEKTQAKLQLDRFPSRIECYDISNIQGQDAVASRVVFMDGAPDKNLYRRYKIRTVEGANDFAMMKEVLDRRFSRGEEALPDLVVVDGGRGQLAQALAIFEELNVQGVAAVGLAKARTERNFKGKEVKGSLERVFIPGRKNPLALLPHSGVYQLLVHVRDEAHRFAVNYHRTVRKKRTLGG